jgi:hypothetical protein
VDGERSIAKQVGLYYDEWTPRYRAVFRYTFVNVNCFFCAANSFWKCHCGGSWPAARHGPQRAQRASPACIHSCRLAVKPL